MKRLVTIAILLAALSTAWPAAAQSCTHNGEEKAEGSRLGDRECKGGRWVKIGS